MRLGKGYTPILAQAVNRISTHPQYSIKNAVKDFFSPNDDRGDAPGEGNLGR